MVNQESADPGWTDARGNSSEWDGRAVPGSDDGKLYRTSLPAIIEGIDGTLDLLNLWRRFWQQKLSVADQKMLLRVWSGSGKPTLEDLAAACQLRGIDSRPIYLFVTRPALKYLDDAEAAVRELQAATAMELLNKKSDEQRYIVLAVSMNDRRPCGLSEVAKLTRGMVAALSEFQRHLKDDRPVGDFIHGATKLIHAVKRLVLLGEIFSNRSHPMRFELRSLHSAPPKWNGTVITSYCEAAWDAVYPIEILVRNTLSSDEDAEIWKAPWTDDNFARQEVIYREGWQILRSKWSSAAFVETDSLIHGVEWEYAQASTTSEQDERLQKLTSHSSDFRSVNWFDTEYTFTAIQAACIKVLWEAWEDGAPDLGDATILEAADSTADRLAHIFRSRKAGKSGFHLAWGRMIVTGSTKGTHRLAPPA